MPLRANLIHAFAPSVLSVVAAVSCFAQTPVQPVPQFEDVTKQSGLTVPHLAQPGNRYVIESTSGGVGFIDCDNDGRLDIVTVNGSSVDRYRQGGDPMVTLYRQTGDPKTGELKFTDVTQAAGLTRKGYGMGVAVADYYNDGWQELYVTGYGGRRAHPAPKPPKVWRAS